MPLLSKRLILSLPVRLAVLLVFSALYLFAALYVQPGPFSDTLSCLNESGLWIYLLNGLPVVCCALLIELVFNHCGLAVSVTGAVFGVLSLANYFKIKFRQAPLWPWDLTLGGEVAGIARSFSTAMVAMIAVAVIGLVVSIVVSAVFVRSRPLGAVPRIIAVTLLLLAASIAVDKLYADPVLYDSASVRGNRYNEVDRYNSRGFIYSFAHVLASTRIEKPPGYDKQAAKAFVETEGVFTARTKPHILMVMGEAFSDISLNPALDFSGYTDPLRFYKALKERSVSGYLVAPNIGGGTADTEFDVLTGINTRHYRGVPYTFKLVTKPTASLVTELKSLGYANVAIHPGYSWFYNRATAFPCLGFDRFVHLDAFDPKTQSKGGYINETVTMDRVIAELDEHMQASDDPLLEFCVTIQNHGPYADKYASKVEVPANFTTTLALTEPQLNTLYNYFLGLADADRELERLVDWLTACPEPVVLVYFGDHLPSLDYSTYDALLPSGEQGEISGETRLNRVPYLLWQNPAAERLNCVDASALEDRVISTPYLGALLLRSLGFDGASAYFDYAATMADMYPVVLETRYATADGEVYGGEEPEGLAELRRLEYYRFFTGE